MGAYDEVPRSPTIIPLSMLGRGIGDARRKIMLIILLAGIVTMSLVAFRRQDQIGDMIQTSKSHWTNATSSYHGKIYSAGHSADEMIVDPPDDGDRRINETKTIGNEDSSAKQKEAKVNATAAATPTEAFCPGPTMGERQLKDENRRQLRNETLGFGQIYVLNMAGRTDKLDAVRLTSSLMGFNFEVLPGVNGKDVPAKALSGDFSHDRPDHVAGVIGCWRGHMNFAAKIVEHRLASGLILEDDADWDTNFRSQLEYVALGAQALQSTPSESTPFSPYGDDWDLIWLGHCAAQPIDGDYRRVLIKNDNTTTPPEKRVNYGSIPEMWPRYDNTTRIMFWSKGSTCTYSYAVSYAGAQKMLKWMSMDIYNQPVDFGLHDMCSDPKRKFKCIGVFPQIIGDHKPAGGANKDSDIGNQGVQNEVREKGFTYNMVHSARLNVANMIDGKGLEGMESQWPELTPKVVGGVEMEWKEEPVEDTEG